MWRINKLQLYYIQFLNYSFFEITIFNRIQLFYNHIYNSFSKKQKEIEVSSINLKKAFVISLNYRLDRRNDINSQLKDVKLNYDFFDAVYLNKSHKVKDYFTNLSLNHLSHGSLSCAYSHLILLEQISLNNVDDYYIIFEDDIILTHEFELKLNLLLKNFPKDADLFFLGSRNERKRDFKYRCSFGYNKTFNARLGAYAYIVNARSAKKLSKLIKPLNLLCGGIDTAIGILIRQNKINVYQFDQSIVLHNSDSLSNIFNPSALRKKIHANTYSNWPQTIIK